MNFKFKSLYSGFSKKIILQLYFIFFILLNLFDFFNFLSGDIDFFKKILSWILIGYVFYKASFSKIFVGTVDRRFDWLFMIGFCLMGIVKSIFHYLKISDINDFIVFGFFLRLFPSSSEPFLTNSFLAGFFIVVLSSILLLRKHKSKKQSLIGSFKFKGFLKFIGIEYIVLSAVSLFFGLVVFNYVMEWFALAVDSIILFLGLIYYMFLFVHHHTNVKTDNLLSSVSNTGNDFYQNLMKQFSNKSTFLIGVSFILMLHLLVDIGVYLIPFLTGLTNSLYGNFVVDLVPIFNLFNFTNSQFYLDLVTINFEPVSSVSLFIIHLSSIVLFGLLMYLPFYYFYKNIKFEKVKLTKLFEKVFLISLLIQVFVFLMPNLSNPINMDWSLTSQVIGVDLNSNLVLQSGLAPVELLIIFILFLLFILEIKILLNSSINEIISKKIIPTILLSFFFVYILIFGITTVYTEGKTTFYGNQINENNFENYQSYSNLFNEILNNSVSRQLFLNKENIKTKYFDIEYFKMSTYDYTNPNAEHDDFYIIKLTDIDTSKNYEILNHQDRAFFDGNYKDLNKYFSSGEFEFIYYVGKNTFEFDIYLDENKNRNIKLSKDNFKLSEIVKFAEKSKVTNFVEIIRLFILFVFYFFGLIIFSIHFFKTNIRNS